MVLCPHCRRNTRPSLEKHQAGYTLLLPCCGRTVELDHYKRVYRPPREDPDDRHEGHRQETQRGVALTRFYAYGLPSPTPGAGLAEYRWSRELPVAVPVVIYHQEVGRRYKRRRIIGVEVENAGRMQEGDLSLLRRLVQEEFADAYPDGSKNLFWNIYDLGEFYRRMLED